MVVVPITKCTFTMCACAFIMKKSPLIGEVAKDVGWGKLGDTSLSFGEKYTSELKNLSRVVSHCVRTQSLIQRSWNTSWNATNLNLEQNVGKLMKTLRELNISFLPKFRNLYVLN